MFKSLKQKLRKWPGKLVLYCLYEEGGHCLSAIPMAAMAPHLRLASIVNQLQVSVGSCTRSWCDGWKTSGKGRQADGLPRERRADSLVDHEIASPTTKSSLHSHESAPSLGPARMSRHSCRSAHLLPLVELSENLTPSDGHE